MKISWRKRLKYAQYLKNPSSIPKSLKEKIDKHPQKRAVEFKALNTILDRIDYAPFTTAMKKCIAGSYLNPLDKRSLKNLVKILQKGKGYSKRTREAIDSEIPGVLQRFCAGKQTEEDKSDMVEIQEFVLGLMQGEKTRIAQKKGLI